jgi:hypothetical protein
MDVTGTVFQAAFWNLAVLLLVSNVPVCVHAQCAESSSRCGSDLVAFRRSRGQSIDQALGRRDAKHHGVRTLRASDLNGGGRTLRGISLTGCGDRDHCCRR